MAIIYTNSTGLLCKEFSCKENGETERISHASFWEGSATSIDIRSADDLATVIKSLDRNQCIGLGSFKGSDTVEVKLSGQDLLQNQISRTNRYIRHRREVTPLLLDVDAKDLPPDAERRISEAGGLLAAVDECIGSLSQYEHVISPSSSAWVAGADSTGLHIYLFIPDGTQSKRILEDLQLIAWEKGFGWIKVAKDGSLLVRSLFDTAVHGAERLIFEAKPIVHPPLEEEPQHLTINRGELFAPPIIGAQRREKILAKIRAAKVAKKPVGDRTKEDWVRQQADRHGVSIDKFRSFYKREGPLPDTLALPDGRTLGDVLDEFERTGKLISLPDPFFPEKGDGKAAVLPRNERHPDPCLFCFPAGGRVYRFERYACRTMPPKFPQKGISRNEGVTNLKAGFHDAAKRRALISGTQGIGKTQLAINEMSKFAGIVACFVPSHDNAKELQKGFRADVRVEVIHGRKQEGMCKNIRAVEQAIENEKVIPRDVCATCRFRDDCKYLEQGDRIRKLSRDGKPLVILLAHTYIDLPIPGDPELDWAIIDEMPSNLFVESEFYSPDVKAEEVLREVPFPPSRRLRREEFESDRDYDKARQKAGDRYDRAMAEFERMMQVRDAAPTLVNTIIQSKGYPVDLPDDVLEWPWRRKYRMLIEAVQGQHAIWWDGDQVGVSRLLDTSRLSAIPLTFLDGTANINIIRAALGNDIDHAHIVVERDAEVTMVTGRRFSNTSMIGRDDGCGDEESRAFMPRLRKGLSRFSGAFVAGPRKVLERIGYDGLQKHYGALRGLNEFNDCETAVVLGRQLPSPDQVEAIARAYAFATGSEFRSILEESEWYFYRYEGARCASGAGRAIKVEYHPDPWAQRILEQICDAEIAQAIDRVRPIFNRRTIFLLTPRVINITVDKFIEWEEWVAGYSCRAEQAMAQNGFVPLSPTEQARHFPNLWSSRPIASADTKSKEWQERQNDLIEFKYRRAGKQRSSWQKAVADGRLPLPNDVDEKLSPLKDHGVDADERPLKGYRVEGDVNTTLGAILSNPKWDRVVLDNPDGVYGIIERYIGDGEDLPPIDDNEKKDGEDEEGS